MSRKSALGKGLASLITPPGELSPNIEKKELKDQGTLLVDVSMIHPCLGQPRKDFSQDELLELAQSIRENGILQPLIVVQDGKSFEIIAGERRWRAAKLADVQKVPVIVKKATDREKLVWAIIENVQRSDLNSVEEALAYRQLMEDYRLTQEEVAKKVGKERSSVANLLRILKLPTIILEKIRIGELSLGHAKVLLTLKTKNLQEKFGILTIEKSLSVRELESLLKNPQKKEQSKNFDPEIDTLKQSLETKTGLHVNLNIKSDGPGSIALKFHTREEFNRIYDFLMRGENILGE